MNREYSFHVISVFALMWLLPSLGCQASLSPTTTTFPAVNVQSSTPTIASATPMRTPTLTITPSPSSISIETPTPTFARHPEFFTPSAPLRRDEVEARVLDLYRTNAGCRLPCWWGFSPGVTRWESAYKELVEFAPQIVITPGLTESVFVATIYFPVPEYFNYIIHSYVVRDGIIQEIDIEYIPAYVTNYHMPKFLDTYGEPEEIWVDTVQHKPGPLPFGLTLFYPQQGILALYGAGANNNGTRIRACPLEEQSTPFLILWSAKRVLSFRELSAGRSLYGRPIERSLEESTGMSVRQFYNTFKDAANKTSCLVTPAVLWPEQ